MQAPDRPIFQAMLFSKIVPNCKKLGLLDAGDGWLRERFTELGVIQFEDWVDTGEEYAMLDEVAKDRAAASPPSLRSPDPRRRPPTLARTRPSDSDRPATVPPELRRSLAIRRCEAATHRSTSASRPDVEARWRTSPTCSHHVPVVETEPSTSATRRQHRVSQHLCYSPPPTSLVAIPSCGINHSNLHHIVWSTRCPLRRYTDSALTLGRRPPVVRYHPPLLHHLDTR